jgi:hypothetical protein
LRPYGTAMAAAKGCSQAGGAKAAGALAGTIISPDI